MIGKRNNILTTLCTVAIAWYAGGLCAQAPISPNIECITVSGNGDMVLTWQVPDDPQGLGVGYRISRINLIDQSTDPVAVVDDFNATSYTVTAYDGSASAHCFFIETTWSDGTVQQSPASDPTCSVYLVANNALTPGIVQLGWNYPLPDMSPPVGSMVTVLMEYPSGNWQVIAQHDASANVFTHSHEVTVCAVTLRFQVIYSGLTSCDFASNLPGGIYTDETDALAPEIIAASVDSLTNQAQVFWNPSVSPDTWGYIIYQCIPGFNPIPLDTIWDASVLSWQNPDSEAGFGTELYNIAAFDSCLSAGGLPDPGAASLSCVSTIHLTHQWQPCTDDVILNWTPYTGWPEGVSHYEVYAAEEPVPGSGVFEPSVTLAVVNGDQTSYTHQGVTLGSSYRYRVKAVSEVNAYEAASNRRTATVFYPATPQYTYITEATVIDRNTVQINVSVGPGGASEHTYTLERLVAGTETFAIRDAAILAGAGELVFTDDVINTSEQSYTYRITVTNGCGDEVDLSNIGKTIVLSGFINRENLSNVVRWTPYELYTNGVQRYEVYRSIGDELPQLLVTLPPSARDYVDDVGDLLNTPGEFCYRVVAVENNNGLTLPGNPQSNPLCLTQEPVIWVPNAFVVNGFNNTFSPVISFADFDNYRLQVYSRWGDLIFETRDIEASWDGRYRDQLVPEGVYAWFISIADGAGRFYEKRGTVMMMIGPEN